MADPAIRNVLDQSKLFVRRVGSGAGFRMEAELRSRGRLVKRWTHRELDDSRRWRQLKKSDRAYTLNVDVVFTAQAEKTATFEAEVRRPDGSTLSNKKLERKGKRGGPKGHGRIRISMKRT